MYVLALLLSERNRYHLRPGNSPAAAAGHPLVAAV